ncbi:hypothetical protein Taro_022566 [Colocasia esculenta]|uniref:Uncharacterized protein n=1 Tax=Colocasia esculenta TaxID=4460 RepID=A0A843V8R3_COLES|nr:hypothetical protein [Colocasia esculenta]
MQGRRLLKVTEEEIELGSWDGRGALELGGGRVQSYEKTLIGWFFKLRFALVEHLAVVAMGFLVATRSRRIVASRFLERAPEPIASSKCDGVRGNVLGFGVLLDRDRRLCRDEIATGYVSHPEGPGEASQQLPPRRTEETGP